MDDIYKNIEEYKPNKKRKILTVFDDMIADMVCNKKFNRIVTKLFIRDKKLNTSLIFITQSHFIVQKKYQTKFYALFHYENSEQMKTSTSFI